MNNQHVRATVCDVPGCGFRLGPALGCPDHDGPETTSPKMSAVDELVRDGIYPSAEQYMDGFILLIDLIQRRQPIPEEMFGFETWILMLHARTDLKNRTEEVEERDELIDELLAKIAKLESNQDQG